MTRVKDKFIESMCQLVDDVFERIHEELVFYEFEIENHQEELKQDSSSLLDDLHQSTTTITPNQSQHHPNGTIFNFEPFIFDHKGYSSSLSKRQKLSSETSSSVNMETKSIEEIELYSNESFQDQTENDKLGSNDMEQKTNSDGNSTSSQTFETELNLSSQPPLRWYNDQEHCKAYKPPRYRANRVTSREIACQMDGCGQSFLSW